MSRGAYSAWAPGDMIYNIRWKNFNFTATRLTQLDEHWTPGGGARRWLSPRWAKTQGL